jgi:hypothetical protein
MKAIFSLFYVLAIVGSLTHSLFAQQTQFEVVSVKGTVRVKRSNAEVKVGDKIARNEDLMFETIGAVVAIYNPQYGRIVLPENNTSLTATMANATTSGSGSLRGDESIRSAVQLKTNYGRFLVLGKNGQVMPEIYPANDLTRKMVEANPDPKMNPTFAVQYQVDGMQQTKPLPFGRANSTDEWDFKLRVSRQTVFPGINQSRLQDIPQLRMSYTDAAKQEISIPIGTFSPMFIDDETQIKDEVSKLIYGRYFAKNKEEIKKALGTLLKEHYQRFEIAFVEDLYKDDLQTLTNALSFSIYQNKLQQEAAIATLKQFFAYRHNHYIENCRTTKQTAEQLATCEANFKRKDEQFTAEAQRFFMKIAQSLQAIYQDPNYKEETFQLIKSYIEINYRGMIFDDNLLEWLNAELAFDHKRISSSY